MRQMYFSKGTKAIKVNLPTTAGMQFYQIPISEDRHTRARKNFYQCFTQTKTA